MIGSSILLSRYCSPSPRALVDMATTQNHVGAFFSVAIDAEAQADKGRVFVEAVEHPGCPHAF